MRYPTFLLLFAISSSCAGGPDGKKNSSDNNSSAVDGNDLWGENFNVTPTPPAACQESDFPAYDCDGDPVGLWHSSGMCPHVTPLCAEDDLSLTLEVDDTLSFQEDGTVQWGVEHHTTVRRIVPKSCLADGDYCQHIDCQEHRRDSCGCSNGNARSGGPSGTWTKRSDGVVEVEFEEGEGTMKFCAGDGVGDSTYATTFEGDRIIWERSEESN